MGYLSPPEEAIREMPAEIGLFPFLGIYIYILFFSFLLGRWRGILATGAEEWATDCTPERGDEKRSWSG